MPVRCLPVSQIVINSPPIVTVAHTGGGGERGRGGEREEEEEEKEEEEGREGKEEDDTDTDILLNKQNTVFTHSHKKEKVKETKL